MKLTQLKYGKISIFLLMLIPLNLLSCIHEGENSSMVKFAECPDSPNCVSSIADPKDVKHYILPYQLELSTGNAFLRIVEYLENKSDVKILETEEGLYIHAVFISKLMRFKDDVEFRFKQDNSNSSIIDIRSASRIGYSDLGANRSRMEEIRQYLNNF
jgi:uncharacterized protein (DUF1499 family)